jgi:DNA-binding MarR family transcriptional regulator
MLTAPQPSSAHLSLQLPSAQCPSLAAERIRSIQKARRARLAILPPELFSDPAWDMLLELFGCELEQKRISVGSLGAASGVPLATAMRWLRTLEDQGLTCRKADWQDTRRIWISLTPVGSATMHRYFRSISCALTGS